MKLGIDIGGTFTDLVLLNPHSGELAFAKTLTTYPDPTTGILNGVREILDANALQASRIDTIVHGTTLVTNAVIERKGAKTALITTAGFEDVLEIGRELRYDIYDIFLDMPKPLVPRNLRFGVRERMDAQGGILRAIDQGEVLTLVGRLVEEGVESVAVCLLHAFANPAHEQQVGEWIRAAYPRLFYSLSSEVMPEIREYERCSATVMNAYVMPLIGRYLKALEMALQDLGFAGTIQIMVSSGRLSTLEEARLKPVQLLESGPAGGAKASVFFGRLMEQSHLLAFDMGGTTAKASLINDYEPEITYQFEAARVRRFKKGSGLPVRIPVIDLIEIGAGGGSIARVNALGLLQVGPDSAASSPGPASYGLGGEDPTVTDADLVLGYLNESYFLGGTMALSRERAVAAIAENLAYPLGIPVEEAAMGVFRVVNENMANAARVHILEKGLDPRVYAMIAFGGAGPVHAFQVARLLRLPRLIVPVAAGVASALGFLVSPVARESLFSYVQELEGMDWERVNRFLAEKEGESIRFLKQNGLDASEIVIRRVADMRYSGQGHEISVRVPSGVLGPVSVSAIEAGFDAEYTLRYQRTSAGLPRETVTWRTVASGPEPHFFPRQATPGVGGPPKKGERGVFFPGEQGQRLVPVFDRYLLPPGTSLSGPAIIEEKESTTVAGPGSRIHVDAFGNLIIDLFYDE
ncbi:MAG: hydantoinase/oxoprolinase family protein [Haliscomenobacter sp.]